MSLAARISYGQPALPPEVQYELFHSIRKDKQLLKACTVVCKDWEQRLTPELFDIFTIRSVGDRTAESALLELSQAPTRVTESYGRLDVVGFSQFPISCLLSILALLPNVHTLQLVETSIGSADYDPTRRRLSLASLVVVDGDLLTADYNILISLLSHFDRVDSLQLVCHNLPPPPYDSSANWPTLPSVQRLMALHVNLELVERMMLQPQFSQRLAELSLVRCVFKWAELATVAKILGAAQIKRTLQTFELFPLFGDRNFSGDPHRATVELFVNAVASCTSLRRVCLYMHCALPGTTLFEQVSDTFQLHCALIQRMAQAKLPVAVHLKVTVHPDTDTNKLDTFMNTLDWASLDRAASGLIRIRNDGQAPGGGSAPLTLYLARLPKESDAAPADVDLRIKQWDWRRYLPMLTNPADCKLAVV